MTIKYNRTTAVPRDIKTNNKIDYTFLKENNIEQQKQTEKVVYQHTVVDTATDSQAVTQDFILTTITVSLNLGSGGTFVRFYIQVGTEIIYQTFLESGTSEEAFITLNIPIPNWKIKKDTLLITDGLNGGGSQSNGLVSFLGYLI